MKCAQYGELVWLNAGSTGDRSEPQDSAQGTPWGFASSRQVHLTCWLRGGITDDVVVPENFNCQELEEAIRDQLGIGPIGGLRLRGQGSGPLLDDIQLRMFLTCTGEDKHILVFPEDHNVALKEPDEHIVQCKMEGSIPKFCRHKSIQCRELRAAMANAFPGVSVGCMRYGPKDINMLTSAASIAKYLTEESSHEPLKIFPAIKGGSEGNIKKAWKDQLAETLRVKGGLNRKAAETRIAAGVQKLSETVIAKVMIGRTKSDVDTLWNDLIKVSNDEDTGKRNYEWLTKDEKHSAEAQRKQGKRPQEAKPRRRRSCSGG